MTPPDDKRDDHKPREWWIAPDEICDSDNSLIGCNVFTNYGHIPDKFKPHAVCLVENFEYEKLEKRVAELKLAAEEWEREAEELGNDKKQLQARLAAAEAESIAQLQLIGGMDEMMDELRAKYEHLSTWHDNHGIHKLNKQNAEALAWADRLATGLRKIGRSVDHITVRETTNIEEYHREVAAEALAEYQKWRQGK